MRVGKHQHLGNLKKTVLGLANEALCLLHFHFVEIAHKGDTANARKMLGDIETAEADMAAKILHVKLRVKMCFQIRYDLTAKRVGRLLLG